MTKLSHRLKLERADEHLRHLYHAVQVWIDKKPYDTVIELDPQTGENVLRLKNPVGPDPSLSAVVGDALFNMKSALDHLVYALAAKNGSTRLDDSEFPIFSSKAAYNGPNGWRKKIPDIGTGAQAVIERLQPYNSPTPAGLENLFSPTLTILHELHRRDKHRALHIIGGAIQSLSMLGLNANKVRARMSFAMFEDGAEVFRWIDLSQPSGKVDVNPQPYHEIFFHPSVPITPKFPVREILERFIRRPLGDQIIPELEAFL